MRKRRNIYLKKRVVAGYGWGMNKYYIDAHCHLNAGGDMDAVVAAAQRAGVAKCVWNAVTEMDWAPIMNASANTPGVCGAIGIHPWHVGAVRDGWDIRMADALVARPDLMVGEIGLDKNYPDIDAQESVFIRQMEIAADLRRVVHIHWVGAWDRLLRVLIRLGDNIPPRMIMHGFGGSVEIMSMLAQRYPVYFSFGPAVLDNAHRRVQGCVRAAPGQCILAESDGANPIVVMAVVDKISQLRGADMTGVVYINSMGALVNG